MWTDEIGAALREPPRERRAAMVAAGAEIAECDPVPRKGGLNVVGEVPKGQGKFHKLNHDPKADVFDGDSHAQYYRHATDPTSTATFAPSRAPRGGRRASRRRPSRRPGTGRPATRRCRTSSPSRWTAGTGRFPSMADSIKLSRMDVREPARIPRRPIPIAVAGIATAAALVGPLALVHPAAASDTRITGTAYGPGEYAIAGHRPRCGESRTVVSAELDDFGAAVPGTIVLNPKRLARLPTKARLFVYAHECGHQVHGRSEASADCHAAKRGRDRGWLSKGDIAGLCGVFPKAMSSASHAARGARCAVIRACHAGEAGPSEMAGSATYEGAMRGFAGD